MKHEIMQDQNTIDKVKLHEQVLQAIKTVYDPEIPVNIYDLGLIYNVEVNEEGMVNVKMTLTAPTCPEAQNLPASVESAIRSVDWVVDVNLELVWDPPWTKEMMSEEARMLLGFF